MDTPTFIAAVSLGLLGSAHCVGMCGGISSALGVSLAGRNRIEVALLMLGYHIGRISSYAIAGLALGTLGWFVGDLDPTARYTLRLLAALLLIAMGLYVTGWWRGLVRMEQAGQKLWKTVQPLSRRLLPVRSLPNAIALGSLWGWLPCGLVYSTLIWSASSGSPLQSSLQMVGFGLGTLPAVYLTGLFARGLQGMLQAKTTRNLSGLVMIFYGLYSIPGKHQHWVMSLF